MYDVIFREIHDLSTFFASKWFRSKNRYFQFFVQVKLIFFPEVNIENQEY